VGTGPHLNPWLCSNSSYTTVKWLYCAHSDQSQSSLCLLLTLCPHYFFFFNLFLLHLFTSSFSLHLFCFTFFAPSFLLHLFRFIFFASSFSLHLFSFVSPFRFCCFIINMPQRTPTDFPNFHVETGSFFLLAFSIFRSKISFSHYLIISLSI